MNSLSKVLSIFFIAGAFLLPLCLSATTRNGFNLKNSSVPITEILAGGPPKDGIPAINNPKFTTAKKANFLKPEDRVIGIFYSGVAKAYPIRILNWHEIVNDEIKDNSFVVSFCPLCGTGVVFSAKIKEKKLTFGVSGLLYNSDVLLYDKQSESLWSQLLAEAVTGKFLSQKLTILPAEHTTWRRWKKLHPKTLVLSKDTGFQRNYDRDPYQGYAQSRAIFFRVSNQAPEIYHPKERVLGLEVKGKYKAYPFVELSKNGKEKFQDNFQNQKFTIRWDKKNRSAIITDSKGNPIPTIQAFWFAWFTFHPKTSLYQAK